MSTVEFYPEVGVADDAQVKRDYFNATWTDCCQDTTPSHLVIYKSGATYVGCLSGTLSYWNAIARMIFCINTNNLLATASISSGKFKAYCEGKVDQAARAGDFYLCLYDCSPTDPSNLVKEDFDYTLFNGMVKCSDDVIHYGDISSGAYIEWTLNAYGLTKIAKGGITKLALCMQDNGAGWETALDYNSSQKYTYILFDLLRNGDSTKPILEITGSGLIGGPGGGNPTNLLVTEGFI